MFYELITHEENDMISELRKPYYLDQHDESGYGISTKHYVDNAALLETWDFAKQDHFRKVFGESLILKKKVSVQLEDEALHNSFSKLFYGYDRMNTASRFLDLLSARLNQANVDHPMVESTLFSTMDLGQYIKREFGVEAWISNTYVGKDIEFNLTDGSTFSLKNGCKAMKALGKMAKGCMLYETFEPLRLKQSQIMNESNIKDATLCLSIHPLDYMTASFNENGWRSCMCWCDGEYRRGVIEMMNSPYVVVAYLESQHEELILNSRLKWNSKKWREFFIVSPWCISGIKGYPYANQNLEKQTLKWLYELFKDEYAANDNEIYPTLAEYDYTTITDKDRFPQWWAIADDDHRARIEMECGPAMYNDFYDSDATRYFMYLTKTGCDTDENNCVTINYSGLGQCMICGGKSSYYSSSFDNESDLVCNDCATYVYCDDCGERIYDGDQYEVFGRTLCYSCFENLPRCIECDSVMDVDNGYGHFVTVCTDREYERLKEVIKEIKAYNDEQRKLHVWTPYLRNLSSEINPTQVYDAYGYGSHYSSEVYRFDNTIRARQHALCDNCFADAFKPEYVQRVKDNNWDIEIQGIKILPINALTEAGREMLGANELEEFEKFAKNHFQSDYHVI